MHENKTEDEIIERMDKLFSTLRNHEEYTVDKIVPGQMGVYDELHELDKELENRFNDAWLNYHNYKEQNEEN